MNFIANPLPAHFGRYQRDVCSWLQGRQIGKLAANLTANDLSVKFPKKSLANYGQPKHLAHVNPTSQTTARVVQTELQPQLQQQLDEVSSHCAGFTVRVKAWFASFFVQQIPYGYEDADGFHYGKPDSEIADHR
ncbi:MAG: hypothetical protein QM813_13185 [Verrucomicrobiota bacterium]